MEPVPVRVHQLINAARAGYIIRCPRTRAAALVDPAPSLHPELEALVTKHALKVRFVLRTGIGTGGDSSRYGQMLAGLGLGPIDAEAPSGPDPFEQVALVGPVKGGSEERAAPEAALLQAGESTVGVRLFDGTAPSEPRFTIGGSLLGDQLPTAHICGSARVALGAFFVQVLPVAQGQVAYAVQDRLFSGAPVGATDAVLLGLPPDTIVYPGLVQEGSAVTTVGQECRARPGVAPAGEAVEWLG